jgi:hypothetical protein
LQFLIELWQKIGELVKQVGAKGKFCGVCYGCFGLCGLQGLQPLCI